MAPRASCLIRPGTSGMLVLPENRVIAGGLEQAKSSSGTHTPAAAYYTNVFSGSLLLQEIGVQRMTGSDCLEERLDNGRWRCS